MSRILLGSELEEAVHWMDLAVQEASNATCAKDRRGVVLVNNGILIGKGANNPPCGYTCDRAVCWDICRTYAVHAEKNAVADAIRAHQPIVGSTMYHARVENGHLMDSRKPRCPDCSKDLLAFGVGRFVLKHTEGYTLYEMPEFHKISIENYIARLQK